MRSFCKLFVDNWETCGLGETLGHSGGDIDDIDDINNVGGLARAVLVGSVRGWRAEHAASEKT